MKDSKRTYAYFKFYDRSKMQAYLEKMAEKGWLLTQSTDLCWQFRRIEPKKLHFSVVYFPKESLFSPNISERLSRLHEFCAHTGWQLASSNAQVQFFYNEAEDPVPIETDAVLEVENIHRATKKRFLPAYAVELVLALFNLIFQMIQCARNPVSNLSAWGTLVYLLCWGIIVLLSLTELTGYFLWHKRAVKTAEEENRFKEPNNHPAHMLFIIPTLFLGFTVFIADHIGQGLGLFAALATAGLLLLACVVTLFCFLGLLRLMKKYKLPSAVTRIVSPFGAAIVCFLLFFPLMGFVINCFSDAARQRTREAAVAYEYRDHTFYAYQDELPLTVSDLTETEYTEYSRVCTSSETVFLSSLEGQEKPRKNALWEPSLEYRIVQVKLPFLYDLCFNTMVQNLAHNMGTPEPMPDAWIQARTTDASPWGADAAYQLFLGGEPQNRYLICYENVIVEMDFDWAVTAEQMRKVSETVQNLTK